jgi:histidinol-phosphate aminotransferase
MPIDPDSPPPTPAAIVERISRLIRPEIRALSPYPVAPSEGLIKLDAMENPYAWPPEQRPALLERLGAVELNRYPDAGAAPVKARLREVMGVPDDMEVLLGNGSDEIIQMLQLAVAGPGRCVLAPSPTFVMYELIAAWVGMQFEPVPLKADFELDAAAMLDAVARLEPALIFLAYPNNPTGNLFNADAVEAVIRAASGLVVLDEAYHAFSDASFMPRLGEFDNLLVMRTVSKLGLAGIRLGALAGPREWIGELDKVRLPYNINSLTQAAACETLDRHEVLAGQVARIRAERERVLAALQAMPGVEPFPSATNFILFRLGAAQPETVDAGLRERGVLVRNLHRPGSALEGCLRVSIGLPAENDAFLAALAQLARPL